MYNLEVEEKRLTVVLYASWRVHAWLQQNCLSLITFFLLYYVHCIILILSNKLRVDSRKVDNWTLSQSVSHDLGYIKHSDYVIQKINPANHQGSLPFPLSHSSLEGDHEQVVVALLGDHLQRGSLASMHTFLWIFTIFVPLSSRSRLYRFHLLCFCTFFESRFQIFRV